MRLIITIILVLAAVYAGYQFYPQLYKGISGKEAPLGTKEVITIEAPDSTTGQEGEPTDPQSEES